MSGASRTPFFLVLGQPRSGTTLIAQCLTGHPDLVIPDESDLVIPLAFLCDRVIDTGRGRAMAADLIVGSERFEISIGQFLTEAEVRAAVDRAPWSTAGILSSVYGALAASAGATMAGDKSPNDLQYSRALAKTGVFDGDVPIVHVVRDIRDVMVSRLELEWGSGLNPRMAREWESNNLRLRALAGDKGAPYLLVRYEDVVRGPEPEFERICGFLGVEFEPAMLSEESRYAQYEGHAAVGQHDLTFEPITTARIGRYAGVLDEAMLTTVNRLAADALVAFGYEDDAAVARRPRGRRRLWPWARTS
jgi:hypothetical protein